METLGILVNTLRNVRAVIALACAARQRGKDVRVFLTGPGVRLLEIDAFRKAVPSDCVWVGTAGFQHQGPDRTMPASPSRLAEFIRFCDRHVVL